MFKSALPTLLLGHGKWPPHENEKKPKTIKKGKKSERPRVPPVSEILEEHLYASNVSKDVFQMAEELKQARKKIEDLQKELDASRNSKMRWRVKAKKKSSLLSNLKNMFPEDEVENATSDSNARLNFLSKLSTKRKEKYPKEIRDFAARVYKYSPPCYNYLRTKFSLPCPTQIRKWKKKDGGARP